MRFRVVFAILCGLVLSMTCDSHGAEVRARGAIKTPAHKMLSAPKYVPRLRAGPGAAPASFGIIPKQLSYWLNNLKGDCVTAEEAFAKAMFSLMNGGTTELFIPDAEVERFATKYGFLNGAYLTEVMDRMISEGFSVNGQSYKDGPYQAVDFTNDATLSNALLEGPVKIGVAADQLENAVGSANGWVATGFGRDQNTDHCVCLCGYGTMAEQAAMLGVKLPAGVNPSARGYLLFTWKTIGIIDQKSLIAITSEAWLRTPTTVGQAPQPNPNPTPTPNPPAPNPPAPTPPAPNPKPGIVGYTAAYSGRTSWGATFTVPALPVYGEVNPTPPTPAPNPTQICVPGRTMRSRPMLRRLHRHR